jgi:type IV pilus assembly protein PilA
MVEMDGAARGFTLIELMVVVSVLGILSTVAVLSTTKYAKRAKTSEAKVNLAKIYDGTSAYFLTEHSDRGEVEMIGEGGDLKKTALHRCPHKKNKKKGQAKTTPKLNKHCADGPSGRCVPGVGAGGKGRYKMSQWTDNDIWNGLNFQMEQAHYFHYNFRFKNKLKGHGSCQFTAQAFADLDDDGVYSTFERTGAADEHGVNAAVGLYIDQELE